MCLARDEDFPRMDLSPFPSTGSCQPRKVSSKTAGHGQLRDGLSHVPCTGVSAIGSHHCIPFRLPPLPAAVPAFHHLPKNIPSSDLGHLSRCENYSTHFLMSIVVKAVLEFQKGFSGLMPLACWLFLVPFCSSQTLGFQSSSSGPAAVVTLEERGMGSLLEVE